MLRTAVVIDYQNVHLTAHDVFRPEGGRPAALIDPMAFAVTAIRRRNELQRPGYPRASLQRVTAYRGLPHADHDAEQHRRCLDQAGRWRAAGARVELRDLKYRYQLAADSHPVIDIHGRKVPVGRPKEKGIDVLCALACVREALAPDIDLVVLASRDTDLVPVLDEVWDMHRVRPEEVAAIETVSWFHREAATLGLPVLGHLRPTGDRRTWNTNLDVDCFHAARDRHVDR